MLTNEEKTRIELEEKYKSEILQKLKPKSNLDLVETITKVLQGLAIIVGIWATYYAYQKQNEENKIQEKINHAQTAKEFRKGFYEKQFQFYAEASDAVATLATEKIGSEDYIKARQNFYRLFWGKLSIVEDSTVESKMVIFEKLLSRYEAGDNEVTQSDLQQASLQLAHSASKYTINVWLDSTERKAYNR